MNKTPSINNLDALWHLHTGAFELELFFIIEQYNLKKKKLVSNYLRKRQSCCRTSPDRPVAIFNYHSLCLRKKQCCFDVVYTGLIMHTLYSTFKHQYKL